MPEEITKSQLGRNEPCHCGSGKKYKRCHGVDAAPKLSTPAVSMPTPTEKGAFPGGFDPSQMDPQMMQQFTQMLGRLPKGQLQRLQSIMQRAMAGKDVTQDAAEFERTLPPELQSLMLSFAGQMQAGMAGMPGAPGMGGMPGAADAGSGEMTEEQARAIVAAAAAEGKVSESQAKDLLSAPPKPEKKSTFGKLFGK